MTFLTDSIDIQRIQFSAKLNQKQRSELGQFLTPAPLARFIAQQFNEVQDHVRILDPGAGVGVLTAAFVERLLVLPKIKSCFLTAYEIEPLFFPLLKDSLSQCCEVLNQRGIEADYCLYQQSFIDTTKFALPLFNAKPRKFTHAILNPPYRKIHSSSIERKQLSQIGIETVNLYSAFIWLAMLHLEDGGELAASTPRSFCNGTYFRPFRQAFLQEMVFNNIHIFESRSAAFSEDAVLQENIVFHAIKTPKKPDIVTISSSIEDAIDELTIKLVPYTAVIGPDDASMIVHIVTDYLEDAFRKQMEEFPSTLEDLGLEVSTGPVVDFRLKTSLRSYLDEQSVPLIYPESIRSGKVSYPPAKPRKPIAIEQNEETTKWLNRPGWYVLTKRFSAKEEKRRIVAAVCPPLDALNFGIENHLNYYHAQRRGMDVNLARGLTTFLNSTLFDNYFRQFSGHTQVNATDLRRIRYPSKDDLIKLGEIVGNSLLNQEQLDKLVHKTLSVMSETTNALQANQRINESIAILKDISAPREQLNERSALSLLALADIKPETPWSQAQAPRRGITEMVDWFRNHYGKQYAPNLTGRQNSLKSL